MLKGIVFDIQRYSIHDGPGIRTVIFLKGCTLHCKWCANPEGINNKPQLFYIRSRCAHCGKCTEKAPNNSIKLKPDGELDIDFKTINAISDFDWLNVCPTGALCVKGEEMSVEDVLKIVMRDEVYYRRSSGGITISGGEPLLQADFTLELLKETKKRQISTAVETSGNVPWESIEKVKPYVDVFMYDIKAADSITHTKCTGKSNEIIIDNLHRLINSGENVFVRTPLIPGFNDSVESINEILSVLKKANVKNYSILPFHQYGSSKYKSIGESHDLEGYQIHPDAYVEMVREVISKSGINTDN